MRILVVALSLFSSLALANQCKASCRESQKECEKQCNTVVKKGNPGQVGACTNQCKQFTQECEQECNDEAGKR